ncbi:gas vesicle protein [Nonomuraea terrae]|uniref:Gas vesicle protein n=1 Tax=Nonomuraea terrae TaxID=2530383 RepID=A0A4R4YZL3_9ACTN|nr:gas vesicle protein GvpO [Nonomuraea terrae]TDD51021.1 gas vesicle protein [Nonomuraea terrae]
MPTTRRTTVTKTRARPSTDEEEGTRAAASGEVDQRAPASGEAGARGAARPQRQQPRELTAATAGGVGVRHIADLTSKHTEGVTSVEPVEDGWIVSVEVVEDRRIPSSGDILAIYQAKIDREGSLLSYRRTRRYRRSNADIGEAF